ncbi:hypothetical protein EN792_063875 [Mesorhizobium sp. M00.F.Ca.ET.149.01.1.1]|nr:hypothetical protein EN792_063875 [Mesorhizobium sp. M00.F.Ca.ET.149.01.1.1]
MRGAPGKASVPFRWNTSAASLSRNSLTPLEHPSSVSALRADPPSPTRGEGRSRATPAGRPFPPYSRRCPPRLSHRACQPPRGAP